MDEREVREGEKRLWIVIDIEIPHVTLVQ